MWGTSLNTSNTVSKQAEHKTGDGKDFEQVRQGKKRVGGLEAQRYFNKQIWLDRLKLQIAFSTQFLTLIKKRGELQLQATITFSICFLWPKWDNGEPCFVLFPACW